MRKVFLLDDVRDEIAAYSSANIDISSIKNDNIIIARTFNDGLNAVMSSDRFDLWILDHDLGCFDSSGIERSGYDFFAPLHL
jgi:hypothetical protein